MLMRVIYALLSVLYMFLDAVERAGQRAYALFEQIHPIFCEHQWRFMTARAVEADGEQLIIEELVCVKCGMIKHKRVT